MISLQASTPPADTGSTSIGPAPGHPAELALRIGGTVIGVALAVATAVWEAVLTTWYVIISGHVIRLPVAPLLAVAANLAIFWFTRKVTGKLGLAIFPALGWLAVMVIAGNVSSDGDLLVAGTWVGIATLLLGTAAWAVPGYRALLKLQKRAPVSAGQATTRPTTGKLISGRPATGKPISGRPATGKPISGRPATGKPISGRQTGEKPAAGAATEAGAPGVKSPGVKSPKPSGVAASGPKDKRR